MAISLRLYFFCTILIVFVKADDLPRPEQEVLQPEESNGIFGVSSVAGIASRNGRVSSLGGIQIYPGLDQQITYTSNDGAGYYYPLTVTKEGDGKYASGSIQLYPGSVVVSSTARSGYPSDIKALPLSINRPFKEFLFQPVPDFFEKQRNIDPIEPWFLKNMFPFSPPRPDVAENPWLYPTFNPFLNFWR
ncbi:uncharacterized protein LOC114357511 [Ostrinia furnacalis]|uniref:uncharacterized protein LOC114357511 n=1 Tax=Ostrinia furnacalis TaxID=93504 RepID=UPI0010409CA2|nr:uncharacterized protein LOC114357511 [Ostrinia furnacalis]